MCMKAYDCMQILLLFVGLYGGFYVALTLFQSYRDLEARDTQSLKS